MSRTGLTPFTVAVPADDVEDLRRRLRATRWPEPATVDDRSQGVPLDELQRLCAYRAEGYDWAGARGPDQPGRAVRDRARRAAHPRPARPVTARARLPAGPGPRVAGIGPRVPRRPRPADRRGHARRRPGGRLHRRRPVAARLRLERQADGARLGPDPDRRRVGRAHDPARVPAVRRAGRGHRVVRLGEPRRPPPRPGCRHPPQHGGHRPTGGPHGVHRAKAARAGAGAQYRAVDAVYNRQQRTRPQTLGDALTDSPAGQCAWILEWILEKFWSWTDSGGDPVGGLGADRILDHVSVYWLTGSTTSSARMYREPAARTPTVHVPTGVSLYPNDICQPPQEWAAAQFRDLRMWREHERGGHFAAMEEPGLLADDVRDFVRPLR